MYRVILIDDDIWALADMRETFHFERHGFEIAGEYQNAEEAIASIEHNPPNLIVSDICMSAGSGLEVAAYCRNTFPDTYVILVSGHERFDYAQEALKHGVFAYLLKPLSDSEVEDTMKRLLDQMQSNDLPVFSDDLIGKAMNYIEEHYMISLPLEEVSNAIHVNKNYLSELFSKKLDMTFTMYKNSVRIRHAKQLIQHGGLSMAEIAQMTGFDSSSRFSKVFHQIAGVTPQQFLKQSESSKKQ